MWIGMMVVSVVMVVTVLVAVTVRVVVRMAMSMVMTVCMLVVVGFGWACADPFDVMVMALLRQTDLRLEP